MTAYSLLTRDKLLLIIVIIEYTILWVIETAGEIKSNPRDWYNPKQKSHSKQINVKYFKNI